MILPADLQTMRDALVRLRSQGVRTFRDQSGEEITYASDREMQNAIAALDREIAGRRNPSTIIFRTKGY